MATYKPGTRINLKEDKLTTTSKRIAKYIAVLMALYGFMDLALRVNGY